MATNKLYKNQQTSSNNKLTKTFLLQHFTKLPVPSFILSNIKELSKVYSEESLSPVAGKEFKLPMSKAIMPPWKVDTTSGKGSYGQSRKGYRQYEEVDDDKGIMIANDNKHSNVNNAPLWFDSKETTTRKEDFSMEEIASRQFSLEEEKANFRKKAEGSDKARDNKNIEDIFASFEDGGEFSNIDVKFENSLKKDTFVDPAIASTTQAINLTELEPELIKDGKEEEAPVWDSYTAEEIKNESQKYMDNWGVPLDTVKGTHYDFGEEMGNPNGTYHENNPFCHPSLNAKESDRVWYYNDNQNCIQGPFSGIEMFEWFKGGYFHPGLLLRCGKYSAFITLRDYFVSISYKPDETQLINPDRMYYESRDLAMENLAGQFSPLSLESPRPYYQSSPMIGYIAPMHSYYPNYPSPSYAARGYIAEPSVRMRAPNPASYQPESNMFFARPNYR